MIDDDDMPSLYAWGRDGIPGEVRMMIRQADTMERERQCLPFYRGPAIFMEHGVRALARHALTELKEEMAQAVPSPSKSKAVFEPSENIREIAFTLYLYCNAWKRPSPPELVHLLFRVMRLRENKGFEGIDRSKQQAFLEASRIDGEDVSGELKSDAALAKELQDRKFKVDRMTINRWRKRQDYKRRCHAARWAKSTSEIQKIK